MIVGKQEILSGIILTAFLFSYTVMSLPINTVFHSKHHLQDNSYVSFYGCDTSETGPYPMNYVYGYLVDSCRSFGNSTADDDIPYLSMKYLSHTENLIHNDINYIRINYNQFESSDCTGVAIPGFTQPPLLCNGEYYGGITNSFPNGGNTGGVLLKTYADSSCSSVTEFKFFPSNTCVNGFKFNCSDTTTFKYSFEDMQGCGGDGSVSKTYQNTNNCSYADSSYVSYSCFEAKQSSSKSDEISTCFSSDALVDKENEGSVPISSVQIGDRILSVTKEGDFKYAEVVSVPHSANLIEASFLTLSTSAGDIRLTPEHLLMVARECGSVAPQLRRADDVAVGFCLMTAAGPAPVTAVAVTRGRGVYTIVTNEELIVVNGFIASPFALNHAAAHSFYLIHRILFHIAPDLMKRIPLLSIACQRLMAYFTSAAFAV